MKPIYFLIFILSAISSSVDALTYQEAVDTAVAQAPQIQAGQQAVLANQSLEISSGRLPDPNVVLGMDNLPISGADRFSTTDDFMTMKKVGIMQDIPNSDKRSAEQKIASAKTQAAEQTLAGEKLVIQRDTGFAWLMVYYLQQKYQINKMLITNNQTLIDSLTQTVKSGRVNNQSELISAQQKKNELLDQRDLLNLDLARAKNELRRFIGDQAAAPISGKPPTLSVNAQYLTQQLNYHPEISKFEALNTQAQAELLAAQADKKPDWGVGVTYQHRDDVYGDMASVEFKMGLPFFSSTRQDPRIAAKQHELTAVAFDREATYRAHHAELASDLATYDVLTKQIKRIEQERLPLAQKNITELQARYKAAQVELRDLNEAQQALYELQMQKSDLQLQKDIIAIKLHYLGGEIL